MDCRVTCPVCARVMMGSSGNSSTVNCFRFLQALSTWSLGDKYGGSLGNFLISTLPPSSWISTFPSATSVAKTHSSQCSVQGPNNRNNHRDAWVLGKSTGWVYPVHSCATYSTRCASFPSTWWSLHVADHFPSHIDKYICIRSY